VSPFRYGVISDIHANLQALEAVTGALERIGLDSYLCPGDLVGYGAQPNECLEVVAGLEAVCVAGNHDLMAIGELPTDKCIPLGRRAIRWTRDVLSDEARAYLCALPRRAEAEGGIVIAHGALHDPERYILTTDQAGAELDRLAREHPGSRALVVGHTHQAFASDGRRTTGEPATEGELALAGAPAWLLNPGAVGQSRERRAVARFMVLDLDRDRASFHAVGYGVARARQVLRSHGLPARSVHLRPTPWRAARRLSRRVLRPVKRRIAGARRGRTAHR
jgi:predicted phosphodiesterase